MSDEANASTGSGSDQPDPAHVRTYLEVRLTGQPNGDYPRYEHTAHEAHEVAILLRIWENIQSGKYPWTDTKLESREVTITHTPWEDISDMRITRKGDDQ